MKNIGGFYLKIFNFLEVKFSIYLNRRVFVMFAEILIRYARIRETCYGDRRGDVHEEVKRHYSLGYM